LDVERLDLGVGLQRVEDGVDDQGTRVGLDEPLQAENLTARVAVEGVVGEPGGEISVRGGSLDVRFPDSRIAFFQGTGRWAVAVVRTVR